jgi:hypothetical protein
LGIVGGDQFKMAKKQEHNKHHEGILIIGFVVVVVGLLIMILNPLTGNSAGQAIMNPADLCEPERTCKDWIWIDQLTSECKEWGLVEKPVCIKYDLDGAGELMCTEWQNEVEECLEFKTVSVQDCRRYGYVNRCE